MADTCTLDCILNRYPPQESSLVEILHDVQSTFRHLPQVEMARIAAHCSVPLARLMAVATFYKAFSFTPKGDCVIKVCTGTACHVKGAGLIREEAEKKLGIRSGETTADGRYTLELVNCVGACAMAPVVIENEQYHGMFKTVDLDKLIRVKE